MNRITINGISLDPVSYTSAGLMSADASGSNYLLIQSTAPLTAAQKTELAAAGVTLHEYVSENTYLAAYPQSDLSRLRSLPYVAWVDVYLKGFKVAPGLRAPGANPAAWIVPPAAAPSTSRTLRTVDVLLHQGVDPYAADLKRRIGAAARVHPDDLPMGRRKVRLTVQESYLDDLAEIDEVRLIEEVPPVALGNIVARGIVSAHVDIGGTIYQGDGQTIAVADTGFDIGDPLNVHPAFTGRLVRLYALGRTSPAKTDDPHGHGTHVCGSAVGDGPSFGIGGGWIQGTAPRARFVVQSLYDTGGGLGGIPADLTDLFLPPYNNDGARVHTNSWGTDASGVPYTTGALEIDQFVWDHQDCVILFCAMNEGTDGNSDGVVDFGQLGANAAAKNCITVGASETMRQEMEGVLPYGSIWPSRFMAFPIKDDRIYENPNGMFAMSGRGPTREGRIKPDLVAPGTCILSTRSRLLGSVSTTFGTSDLR
jgi:serine protease AprX